MNFDEHATFSERHPSSGLLTDLEDGEDFAIIQSGASVASSEWRNVSSSSSSSSLDDQLTAKDIVNCREFWEVWSTHHPVIMTEIRDIPPCHPLFQDIYSVFQFAYRIPWCRFNMHPAGHNHVPDSLQDFLTQSMEIDPDNPSEYASVYPQLNAENGLDIAAVALEVHHAALRLTQGGDMVSDEYWTAQVHDTLIVKCAKGRSLKSSETWTLQTRDHIYSQTDLAPISANILSVQGFQPHGAILVVPEPGTVAPDRVLLAAGSNVPLGIAAVFSTRSQVASQLRDTPESVALHYFSVMATSTVLAQMSTCGINLPVFGVMLDRNIVRLHVDWSMVALGNHISVSLPQTDTSAARLSPFRDFDLTVPQDSLRVAFIFDALDAYAQYRLSPVVRAIFNSWQWTSQSVSRQCLSLGLNEISSEEKVQAWMQSGAMAGV